MQFIYPKKIVGIIFLFLAVASLSHAASQADLRGLLENNPHEAKRMLLINPSDFGDNPRGNAIEIADALREEGEWEGAVQMYQLWGKLFRSNFPEYRNISIWAEYLDACLWIYESKPQYLGTWNVYFKKSRNWAPKKNKVKRTALEYLTNRFGEDSEKLSRNANQNTELLTLAIYAGYLTSKPVTEKQSDVVSNQILNEVLDENPLKAKKIYLQGHYLKFGDDPAVIALTIADALHLEGHYKDASEMYDQWLKYYKNNDQSFRDFKKWSYYLEACLEAYEKNDDREPLRKWNEHYKKVKNENRPKKKLVVDKATEFIEEAIGKFHRSKKDEDWPGKEIITLADRIGYNVNDSISVKERLDRFQGLLRKKQSRKQVHQVNDIIRQFKSERIPVEADIVAKYANLVNYYTFYESGKEEALTSPKEACELFKSALVVLDNANGNDTENVKCYKQKSCIKADLKEFLVYKPSADDVEAAYDLTEVAKLLKIKNIKNIIDSFNLSSLCKSLDPIDDDYLKVIESYYSAVKALSEKPEIPGRLRTFYNNYKDVSNYEKWVRMAGYHLGHYYYFISADLLKNGPGKNNRTIMLQNLSLYIRSFIRYKDYVVLKDEHMDVVKQHNALKTFWAQVSSKSTEAIQTANALDMKVEKAWEVSKALNPIWKREHTFATASDDLENGKTRRMEKWVKSAISDYDKKRGSEKLLEPYQKKTSTLLYMKNRNNEKRTKEADWKDLQKIMARYKTYRGYAKQDKLTTEEKEFAKLSRIFGGKYDGNIKEAKYDIRKLNHKVRNTWSISAEEVARASSDESGSFFSSLFGKKAPTKNKQHSQEGRKASSTTTKKSGDIKQKKFDEAALAFEEYRYLEAWKIYGEIYPEIIPLRHMDLLLPNKRPGVVKSLPSRERGILEMLARIMHAVEGQRSIDQYVQEIRRECDEPICKHRLFVGIPDFKAPEIKGDFAYIAGLRDHNKGRNGSAAKFYLLALKHLLEVPESSKGYNRVNQKILHWTDALKRHYYYNLVLRSKEDLHLYFWRDERYSPRQKVVLHLKTHGIDLGDTPPGLTLTNRNRTVGIEDRVAAFVDMVDYIIYRNERDLPDLEYFKRKFPWREKWISDDPNRIIINVLKELESDVSNEKKMYLRYDLYLALAQLRRIQGRIHDRFENLNIAYRAIIKDPDKINRNNKRRNIKAELSKIKNLEIQGHFTLTSGGVNWLKRNSLFQWWHKQSAGPPPPRKKITPYEEIKKKADSLEGCRDSAAPENKQKQIMDILELSLVELSLISAKNGNESKRRKKYYMRLSYKFKGCLSKKRADYYSKAFDLFLD